MILQHSHFVSQTYTVSFLTKSSYFFGFCTFAELNTALAEVRARRARAQHQFKQQQQQTQMEQQWQLETEQRFERSQMQEVHRWEKGWNAKEESRAHKQTHHLWQQEHKQSQQQKNSRQRHKHQRQHQMHHSIRIDSTNLPLVSTAPIIFDSSSGHAHAPAPPMQQQRTGCMMEGGYGGRSGPFRYEQQQRQPTLVPIGFTAAVGARATDSGSLLARVQELRKTGSAF